VQTSGGFKNIKELLIIELHVCIITSDTESSRTVRA